MDGYFIGCFFFFNAHPPTNFTYALHRLFFFFFFKSLTFRFSICNTPPPILHGLNPSAFFSQSWMHAWHISSASYRIENTELQDHCMSAEHPQVQKSLCKESINPVIHTCRRPFYIQENWKVCTDLWEQKSSCFLQFFHSKRVNFSLSVLSFRNASASTSQDVNNSKHWE